MKKARRFLTIALLVFNAMAILLLWVCCASTWLSPERFPKLALLGLLFPAFVLANLFCTIPWLFVRWRWAWIPLAGTLPCMSFLMDYFPISFGGEPPAGSLKVITWNAAGYGYQSANRDSALTVFRNYIENCDADIICFQEAQTRCIHTEDFYATMERKGYYCHEEMGKAVFSRLPIIAHENITYRSHALEGQSVVNGSIAYRILFQGDTLLLINNHLESNHLNPEEKDEYVRGLDEHNINELKSSGKTVLSKVSQRTAIRAQQADSLANYIQHHDHMPIIMCGDFNDTPISYVYQRINKLLDNAYRKSGNGMGISYNKKGFWVRIDHVFMSHHWKSFKTHIDTTHDISDHYPLVTWLHYEREN
ncbi:MAG: endonuclease/exonuclease/phosphatase family protein [Bacteroidales bacterium]|nr:endonuclease/exonuclease/phosphatase family protein [Candidatus Physcousia equi]